MAGIGLIFTTDYEIFGNGTGSVEHCMIRPTEKMAQLLEKVGAKLTIFFDVCEYWAFQDEFASGKLQENWAGQIKSQLQDLAKRGHDVQLHFHPQWLDYSFDGQRWTLNYNLWRIGTLKYEDEEFPERGLKSLFARGRQTIEQIVREVNPNYKCEVFRAGAWSIQPEGEVLKAMQVNGFKVDSTVAPGLSFTDEITYYNFSKAVKHRFSYKVSRSFNKADEKGELLEIPIWTSEISLWHRVRFLSTKLLRKTPMKPSACSGKAMASAKKSKLKKLQELLGQSRVMFNYSDGISHAEMKFHTQQAIKIAKPKVSRQPVVSISHPKSFGNQKEFEKFLSWASQQNEIHFSLYRQFIKD